ncbi:MAG: CoA synthetase [Proteobacteria bacterium]|nr:CoA synthetase [Pseudomonadota bacterium]MDA1057072.1 CoA synthetase [Pseudomonadota bacterium]
MTTWTTVDEVASMIPDGSALALIRDGCGVAMSATRALIRRGVRDLRLVNVPTGGIQTDLLIGAGCVAELETSGVSLGEYGPAGRFAQAVTSGTLTLKEATCPAIHAGLQAAEKGAPFLPLRGVLGSDILRFRPDWRVINNPLNDAAEDPVVVIPAITPDIALFHCAMADDAGNVWVGRERDLITMAHAARQTLVTVERRYPGNLFDDAALAAGTLSSFYVTAVAPAAEGCKPLGFTGHYGEDEDALRAYAKASRRDAEFATYLAAYATAPAAV